MIIRFSIIQISRFWNWKFPILIKLVCAMWLFSKDFSIYCNINSIFFINFNLNYYEWLLIRNKRRATGSPTSLQQLLIQDYCSLFYTLSFFLSEKQYNLSKMNSYSKKCTTAWTSLKYQSTHQRLSKDQSPKTTNFTKSLERKARKNKTIFGAKS